MHPENYQILTIWMCALQMCICTGGLSSKGGGKVPLKVLDVAFVRT